MRSDAIERVHRALEDIAAGKMVVLVDDEERENEGDLVMAADLVTPEAINFMARFGRGLIFLALEPNRVDRLGLPMMVDDNRTQRTTAFTVSIEARDGVTTGISARDRAHTVLVAVAPDAKAEDIVSPGHVFPLRAVSGGVLQRAGHTEGSVDLARLAGRSAAGVICEIMNDDGSMARMPELAAFAAQHGIRILSIADLINYRMQTERLVRKLSEGALVLPPGLHSWQAHVYETAGLDPAAPALRGGAARGGNEMLALTLGAIDAQPTLVRVQVGSVLGDVFGARSSTRAVVEEAVRRIEAEGRGVILYIPPRIDMHTELRYHLGEIAPSLRPENEAVLREIGFGAQVLRDLGVRKMKLLTNLPRRIAAVDGYELEVVEQVLLRGTMSEGIQRFEGGFSAPQGARFAIVAARFNDAIVERLIDGALDALRRHGVADANIVLVKAPGAFELPLVCQRLAASGKVEAVIALGCVIRGATPHFDYVAGEAAKGCGNVAISTGVPVVFGVLTTENIEQAVERSGTKAGNKGSDVALAALEMVNLGRTLGEHGY